jgi:CheY-like chemotaxis protein
MVPARNFEILLVDDNPGDVRLTQEALDEGQSRGNLSVVSDGVEALAFLRRQGHYGASSRPDLILLDLNLPRMGGREVLAAIKADEQFRRIPVVILTTSTDERDVASAYDLHANCYIAKPVDFEQFIGVVRALEQFWLTIATLPSA